MVEAALYILIGIAFYGGGHQLYLGASRYQDYPHVLHAGMYFLLAVFALCGVLSYQAQSMAALMPLGKLSITIGILLWMALTWFVAAYTGVKPRLVLALLSAAWAILLISNIGAPYSLLYSDITPISQALPSGQTRLIWQTSINPWWWAVEFGVLATLGYCLYATYRLFRSDDKQAALALAGGLFVLAVTSGADLLISMELLQSAYLTPFGIMVFLLACSMYPGLQAVLKKQAAAQAPSSYNLTFNLHPSAERAQPPGGRAPLREPPAADIEHRPQAGLALEQAPPSTGFAAQIEAEAVAVPRTADSKATAQAAPAQPAERIAPGAAPLARRRTPRAADDTTLTLMSDNLIDIAVHATMLVNRVKRADLDSRTAEELCNKIRSQAIETRRIASRLTTPRRATERNQEPDSD